jgi:hypothetical protein
MSIESKSKLRELALLEQQRGSLPSSIGLQYAFRNVFVRTHLGICASCGRDHLRGSNARGCNRERVGGVGSVTGHFENVQFIFHLS